MKEIETLWASEEKNHNGDSYLKVKRNGVYVYSERVGVNSVAFILFDNSTKKFGLILEYKPTLDTHVLTGFGGSIDKEVSYQEICQEEIAEESGYEVSLDKIHSIGQTLVSSQMNQICEGYLVDVTGIEKTLEAEYETEGEEFANNKIKWLDADELMDNSCWKSCWIFVKSVHLGIINK